jgi:hypothetical protein
MRLRRASQPPTRSRHSRHNGRRANKKSVRQTHPLFRGRESAATALPPSRAPTSGAFAAMPRHHLSHPRPFRWVEPTERHARWTHHFRRASVRNLVLHLQALRKAGRLPGWQRTLQEWSRFRHRLPTGASVTTWPQALPRCRPTFRADCWLYTNWRSAHRSRISRKRGSASAIHGYPSILRSRP